MKPENWLEIYNRIKAFRAENKAAVDSMGCATLSNSAATGALRRYTILTSLQLSSQTRDEMTAEAIGNLSSHPAGFSPELIADMDPKLLNSYIKVVGFHNRKTIYLQKTAKILVEEYKSDIPDTVEKLMDLPGIGPKMAYLTMQEAWNISLGIGVDTHVHRISNRLGWVNQTKNAEGTRKELEEWLPSSKWSEVNSLLVGFGQTLCRPIGPMCSDCPCVDLCPKLGAKPSPRKFGAVKKGIKLERVPIDLSLKDDGEADYNPNSSPKPPEKRLRRSVKVKKEIQSAYFNGDAEDAAKEEKI